MGRFDIVHSSTAEVTVPASQAQKVHFSAARLKAVPTFILSPTFTVEK
jgi:hypothetical protein